ncbi:Stealth CR1 domain-containing protein [Flavobacterium sp. UBA6135]|uniref:Stealth CR1 domain-containing protein n=1 Tax=Flavobacterium sp. UBA6135 TaxID=1946553 RepID=UPI0025B85AFA|nr:Stealth CR1 domain-containing protein [Flavobacterium sp. UBA6135]
MTDKKNKAFDIDAVITWVDGNDENHINKLSQYVENKSSLKSKGFLTRFYQVNEIEFCIKSIKKYAPYVRNIYVVTDNQTPDFLKNNNDFKNVNIVDHKIIFKGYEDFLPVFNSNSIETMIGRIPNLAEHFIYFNDDMLLINETKPSDFFSEEGLPILRGRWTNYESEKLKKFLESVGLKKKRISKLGYKKAQENIARILKFKKYLKVSHTPFSMRKSIINDFLEKNEKVLLNNIKYRFRDPSYFMIQSLAAHLEILNKSFVLQKNFQLLHFGSSDKPLFWIKLKLNSIQNKKEKLFLNIQSLDLYPEKKLNYILNWLIKHMS